MLLGIDDLATTRGRRRTVLVTGAAVAALLLAGCEPDDGGSRADDGTGVTGSVGDDQEGRPDALVPTVTSAEAVGTVVLTGEAPERAAQMSKALFVSAPVVVLASPDEQLRAASAGAALGVPVLLDGEAAAAELERLGAEVALVVGEVADPGIDLVVPADDEELTAHLGTGTPGTPVQDEEAVARVAGLSPAAAELLVPAEAAASVAPPGDAAAASGTPAPTLPDSDRDELPATAAPEPLAAAVVLTTGDDHDLAALGTARAAGATVLVSEDADPRSTTETVQAIAGAKPQAVIGLGEEFGDAETLDHQARVAATGVELPGGGQLVLPDKTYVALYGTPGSGALGVLGEQPDAETVTRAEEVASAYQDLTDEPVIPTLEIIASIASAGRGPDGNYSAERAVAELEPLVDLAGEHGMYVVLDLQPGRTDFVTQAKLYEELLLRPYVGLALDPEWRLKEGEVHLVQIGQVDVAEVNEVVTYLADLTREHDLPQKALVLHQFQPRMIPGVNEVDRSRPELAVLIHVDGQGAQPDKQATWATLRANAPDIEHWGWKNFYDEDIPGPLTPEETMTLVDPVPDFISYQ